MIMATCTICGKQNPDTAKFCTGCGGNLSTTVSQQVINKTNGINKWITTGAIALITIATLVYFLFIEKGKTNTDVVSTAADSTSVQAQPVVQPFVTKSLYSQPRELLYTGKKEKGGYPNPLYPSFYPIGWSRDGKFAYAEEPVDEACGCYFFKIIIQDMNSDKMVWTWGEELSEENGYNIEKDNAYYFKKTWDKNKALFTQKLNQYQIEPLSFTGLEKFPLRQNDTEYTSRINNNSFYYDSFGENVIASTSVSILTNGIEKKKIFKKNYDSEINGELFSSILSNKIYGYIKNPYENRIAVFLLTEQRGWEGPPNVMDFNMIGCDLNNIGTQ